MWKLMAVACVFCASGSGAAQDEPPVKQPIVTSDLLKLRSVTAIDVAQDGSRAVFTIKSIAEAKPSEYDDEGEFVPAKYEYRSHLYLIELADEDSRPIQLTFGRRNDQSPRLSPDGSSVVFVRHPMRDPDAPPAKDDDKDKPQVWLLPLTGGEARQLTDFKEGASEPRYSPIGNAILVTAAIPYDEMEGVPAARMERCPAARRNGWRPHDGPRAAPRWHARRDPRLARSERRAQQPHRHQPPRVSG
jgi:dipeptidyl aminopeptidase/acylaminoacyl peptidase